LRVCVSEDIKSAVSTCGDVKYGFTTDFEFYRLGSLVFCNTCCVRSGRASPSNG